ncbi:polyketide cyclase/dehydrase [Burkholderia ubonensis]|uniref:SRPBCC family protein n=1 Tax=Burkholderia ubonensis TaxID=101571 RepID=UPI000BA795AE|nr:SRPBCC family protein [Burkholderia ubonensis]PAK12960.1 polyketide cyclase/dehydrase [Burkholderia ubonensis]RQP95733.1 polyketide cyclase/dehydrase [Burkholderia ubonensis]
MWTCEKSIDIDATPERIWNLFRDVAGWPRWNNGIEQIEIHGPFADGTTFTMKVPDADSFTSVLLEVRENASFIDETIIDGTRVVVRHEISTMPSGNVRVTYGTEITGPKADEFGPVVTGDFEDVLKSLKSLAEGEPS